MLVIELLTECFFEIIEKGQRDRDNGENSVHYFASSGGEDGCGGSAPTDVDVPLESHREKRRDRVETVKQAHDLVVEVGLSHFVPASSHLHHVHVTTRQRYHFSVQNYFIQFDAVHSLQKTEQKMSAKLSVNEKFELLKLT